MKNWRSHGGLVTLGWLCAVVFVGAITEASLTESTLALRLSYGLMVAAAVVIVFVYFSLRSMKKSAENKVKESAHITLSDVRVLARSNSRLLEDALDLRCSQKGAVGANGG